MFEFFKAGKLLNLLAPIDGKAIDLSEVPDKVFAQRMIGDGIAIIPSSNIVCAPADGMLTLIFKTNHAFGITLKNGLELLVHIGLDTVELKGEGFKRLAMEETFVKAGTPIISFDEKFMAAKNICMITPVLISNMDKVASIKYITNVNVKCKKDVIIKYNLK